MNPTSRPLASCPSGASRPWLLEAARRRPDHAAVMAGGRTLTYAELEHRARRRAAQLLESGLRPGGRLALWMSNELAWLELAHAATLVGAALVPLHARLGEHEVAPLLEDARPDLLVCTPACEPRARLAFQEKGVSSVTPGELDRLDPAPLSALPASRSEAHAILFTSGTTGRPKGVRLGHSQQEASAHASAERLGSSEDDRWLVCMPLYHIGGLAIVVRSVLYTTTLVLHERFEPAAVARSLSEDGITHVSLVPTMLARLLELAPEAPAPRTLRRVLLGGGPIAPLLVERARARDWPLCATYGLTEAASQVATSFPGQRDLSALPPLPHTQIRVVDAEGKDVPPSCPGEIVVQGPQVMEGYLDRPEATARALRHGWLFTGDLGELDPAGRLRVLDRRSDLIVSGGENVYPADVEAVLTRCPEVAEVGVVGQTDPHWGQRVVAVVVPRIGRTAADLERELAAWCSSELASFKRPRRFVLRNQPLPRTASGKLRRDVLRDWIET